MDIIAHISQLGCAVCPQDQVYPPFLIRKRSQRMLCFVFACFPFIGCPVCILRYRNFRCGSFRLSAAAGCDADQHQTKGKYRKEMFHRNSSFLGIKKELFYLPTAPPQNSQQPLASGVVVAPQKGQVTATLGAAAAAISSRACWRTCIRAALISSPISLY